MRTVRKEQTTQALSVTENAARRLRGAIMFGEFQPGQKLIEAELCTDLGISRASLREVLRSLEAEQLVELVPNRGPSVVRLGFEEVAEIHDVWSLLTGEAIYSSLAQQRPLTFVSWKKSFCGSNGCYMGVML